MGLADVVGVLACPHCGAGLELAARVLRCANAHTYDVARQGYVSLLAVGAQTGTADTAGMVEARSAFLAAGHYGGLAARISSAVARAGTAAARVGTTAAGTAAVRAGTAAAGAAAARPRTVADVGAGTGYYLARVLDDLPGAVGVALDVSKFALRRAARAHERIGAVVADAWRGLPLRDASVDVVINVFAPRNAAELARILRPGGALVVVTPTPRHLAELVSRLGLLTVDEDKDARLRETLAGHFTPARAEPYETRMALSPEDVRALVLMGPSAWHVDRASIEGSIDALPDPFAVTLSVSVATFVRPPRG